MVISLARMLFWVIVRMIVLNFDFFGVFGLFVLVLALGLSLSLWPLLRWLLAVLGFFIGIVRLFRLVDLFLSSLSLVLLWSVAVHSGYVR